MLNDTCTTISSISIECFVSHDTAVATNVFLIVTEMPTFSLVWNWFGLQRKGFFTFVPECTSKQTLWGFNLFCFANKFSCRQHIGIQVFLHTTAQKRSNFYLEKYVG